MQATTYEDQLKTRAELPVSCYEMGQLGSARRFFRSEPLARFFFR